MHKNAFAIWGTLQHIPDSLARFMEGDFTLF